jgi:hypothetical protein
VNVSGRRGVENAPLGADAVMSRSPERGSPLSGRGRKREYWVSSATQSPARRVRVVKCVAGAITLGDLSEGQTRSGGVNAVPGAASVERRAQRISDCSER